MLRVTTGVVLVALMIACGNGGAGVVGHGDVVGRHAGDEAADETIDVAQTPRARTVDIPVLRSFPGIDILRIPNFGSHQHGGPPAELRSAFIALELTDARAHEIEVVSLALGGCSDHSKPAKLKILSLALGNQTDSKPLAGNVATFANNASGRYSLHVEFEPVRTYRSCGYTFELVIDRVPHTLDVPLDIKRFEPSRRR